jgi:DNA-binding CsgD family transcriptional regulator
VRCAHGALQLPAAELREQICKTIAAREPEAEVLPPEGTCHPEIAKSGLTPRERDVLGLIAQGLTNQEIADRLFISINSVKTYVRTAYRRIEVERRSQAVVWVERHGLTPAPPSILPDHAAAAG